MAGGLISGTRPGPRRPLARVAGLLGVVAIGNALAAGASSIALLAVALVVAGVAIAPYFALVLGLITTLGPAGAATEATTWLTTGTTAGIAIGAAGGGALIGSSGTHAGFALGAAAVAIASALVALASRGRLVGAVERVGL
jgi:predicted MFS family arabinose efflux permease